MKSALVRGALGVLLVCGISSTPVFAQEEAKTLPTLLIKGEVVSLDNTDPAAALLKVKDRYGFETPIYLTQETKITQADATVTAASLASGSAVEVEYNFDVNTAKRHAVSVKLAVLAASTQPTQATEAAAPAAVTETPEVP